MARVGYSLQELLMVNVKIGTFTTWFLIDYGAVISIVLLFFVTYKTVLSFFVKIYTTSGNSIQLHGKVSLSFNIWSFRRTLSWWFVVADVTMFLLGIGFLLLFIVFIDFGSESLFNLSVDRLTSMRAPATPMQLDVISVHSCESYYQSTYLSS